MQKFFPRVRAASARNAHQWSDSYKCLEYGFVNNVKEQCRRKRVAAFASGGALQVADAPECVCGLDDV